MGYDTVSTLDTKEMLSADPSRTRNTLTLSVRHRTKLFSGPPCPEFSPPAIVLNITRRTSGSFSAPCMTPKRRHHLQLVVSTFSRCALLRALAYDMRLFVHCWRLKPMIRRVKLWCDVRRLKLWCDVRSSARCSLRSVHVIHPHCRASITSAFSLRT